MQKLLEITSLTVGYNEHIVLRDVNLTVYEKDFLGIIGPNGSGKSTLFKVLLGLIPAIKGTVQYHFAQGSGLSSKRKGLLSLLAKRGTEGSEKKLIGYLPQLNIFDRKFPITVMEVVLSGLMGRVGLFQKFSKEDKARAEELLEQMGITDLKSKAIGELSGGQMQRVFLCRALISSPPLLLLDEPNTFVDTSFEVSFYEILKNLNQEKAIVLVSHDIGVIASYVKNIACINNGTLYYHSSNEITPELIGNYNHPVHIIAHNGLAHRVLKTHGGKQC
jgi:zinc transport system ATP-binding protein